MTEPIDAARWAADRVDRPGRGLSTWATCSTTTGPTADRRILWGGYDAVYRYGGDVGPHRDQHQRTFERLAQHFFATFPQLEGVRFSHRWGGAIDTCSRFSLFAGTAHRGRVAYAAGYTGLGVGASRFGARAALELLDGERSGIEQLAMVSRRPLPFPPEPLRSAVIQLTRNRLAAADRGAGGRGLWLTRWTASGSASTPRRERARRSASFPRHERDGSGAPRGGDGARAARGGRPEGAQRRRRRARPEHCRRARVDRAGIQPCGDARLVVIAAGYQTPLIVVLAFIPMFLSAWAAKEMNRADPDCGTSFTWAARALGRAHRLVRRGLGDDRRRFPGDGQLRADRRPVRVPVLRREQDRDRPDERLGAGRRDPLDRRPDLPLLPRDRSLGEDAADPRRDRDGAAARARGLRDPEGRRTPPLRPASGAFVELVQPVNIVSFNKLHGCDAADGLHLLGLGHHDLDQRGERGPEPHPGVGRRDLDVPAARDVPARGGLAADVRRGGTNGHRPRQRQRTRATRCRCSAAPSSAARRSARS